MGPEGGSVSATERVRAALARRDLSVEIIEFPESTRTAADAARAVGSSIAQIVKSLLFIADERPVLVLVSGANRVDLKKLARLIGASRVEKATADTTRAVTGFSIGGVPPTGHLTPLSVVFDETLLRHPTVYAAAGTPHAVFAVDPRALVRVTESVVGDLADAPAEP